jgi:SPP1 family predicted phage head-tail adaptor
VRPQPGALRERLTLEQPLHASDGSGGEDVAFVSAGKMWAMVMPIRVQERADGGRFDTLVTHVVTMRYRADISNGWRFVKADRHLVIRTLRDPDERARYLVCGCEEQGR